MLHVHLSKPTQKTLIKTSFQSHLYSTSYLKHMTLNFIENEIGEGSKFREKYLQLRREKHQ